MGHHFADHGQLHLAADNGEQAGEQHDGQQEIGQRPGGGDEGALAHRLGAVRFRRPEGLAGGFRLCLRVGGHAVHLHIATERQDGDFPFGAMPVHPGFQRRAKAQGERLHTHATPARRQIMAHFMDRDEHSKHEQEAGQCLRQVKHVAHVVSVQAVQSSEYPKRARVKRRGHAPGRKRIGALRHPGP